MPEPWSNFRMEWFELDGLGIAGQRFSGTEDALRTSLLARVGGIGRVTSTVEEVYLAKITAKVHRTVVTLIAPWGRWRFVRDQQ